MNLDSRSPVVVYRVDGDWICGYFSNRQGAAPGWVLGSDVHLISFDQNPPLRAWIGAWAGGEDRVRIQTSNAPGKLGIQGSASWHGSGDVVHTGEFSGEIAPDGNHVHFMQGDTESCTIDLTLFGKYILANDNDRCGGMNVRFWGVWERKSK